MTQTIPSPAARKILAEIIDLAVTTPNETASIFVHYSPHVSGVHVEFYAGGWKKSTGPQWRRDIYLDSADDITIAALESVLLELRTRLDQASAEQLTPMEKRIRSMVEATIAAFCDQGATSHA